MRKTIYIMLMEEKIEIDINKILSKAYAFATKMCISLFITDLVTRYLITVANIVLGLRAQCRQGKRNILMAHYTVPGCNTESGQTMLLTQFEPVILPETLLAADYHLVALGHIHRPQQIMKNEWFYSGAINQLNFNDEGQERGFWIHVGLPNGGWEHFFHKTPIREHITFEFTDTDITAINLGRIDEVAFNYWRFNGAVQDKIVRIHYDCSSENAKAYKANEAVVERADRRWRASRLKWRQ